MHFLSSRKQQGFTFAEVLITVAILSILASVAVISGEGPRKKARDEQRKSDLQQIQLALRLYKDAEGRYPVTNSSDSGLVIGAEPEIDNILAPYMSDIPSDPLTPDDEYEYVYQSQMVCEALGGGSYVVLYARKMENETLANWPEVCDASGTGDELFYGIVLGKAN